MRVKDLAVLSFVLIAFAFAKPSQVKAADKELKKELTAKTDKDSKREAKALKSAGWQVMPGKLPLEKQIEASRLAQLKKNAGGESFFIVGSANVTGGNYTVAKQMADNNAKVEISRSVSDMIASKLTQEFSNMDFGNNKSEAANELAAAVKSVSAMDVKGTEYLLEIFRENGKGGYEARVVMAVSRDKIMSAAKEEMKKSLKDKTSQYLKDLDKLIPY